MEIHNTYYLDFNQKVIKIDARPLVREDREANTIKVIGAKFEISILQYDYPAMATVLVERETGALFTKLKEIDEQYQVADFEREELKDFLYG